MLSNTAKKAIEAYGGMEVWKSHECIEAEVSAKGLAFTLKRRPFLDHANIKMEIGKPFSKLRGISKDKSITGVLNGKDVWLENEKGEIISERKNARDYFSFGRRLFCWDDLDISYFSNYAFWNYFTLPSLLMNPDIIWKELEEGILEATFPDSIPTHSKIQKFHFDKITGRLIQHDYAVDIISKLATPANVVIKHSEENGLLFASERRVTPRTKKDVPLKGPILIDIVVHHFQLKHS